MTVLIDRDEVLSSPALVPAERDLARDGGGELTIGLVNNMPDPALKATERQFMKLLQAVAGTRRIRFHCFSLPSVKRSPEARWHVESEYSDLSDLKRQTFDGLIVTGAEPVAAALDQEPYWPDLTALIWPSWWAVPRRVIVFPVASKKCWPAPLCSPKWSCVLSRPPCRPACCWTIRRPSWMWIIWGNFCEPSQMCVPN